MLCILTFILAFVCPLWLMATLSDTQIYGVIAVAFLSPFVVFFIFKRKMGKMGAAYLSANSLEVILNKESKKIEFKDLLSYKVDEGYKGINLKIKMTDKNVIRIIADTDYCKIADFRVFCNDLKLTIEQFKNG